METTENQITQESAQAFQDAYLELIKEHKMEHVAVLIHKLVQNQHGSIPVYATEMRLRPYPLIEETMSEETTNTPEEVTEEVKEEGETPAEEAPASA